MLRIMKAADKKGSCWKLFWKNLQGIRSYDLSEYDWKIREYLYGDRICNRTIVWTGGMVL